MIERLKVNLPFGMLLLMSRQVKFIRLNYIGSIYEGGKFKVEIDFTDNYLLSYHLSAMNSTVIHGISATLIFSESKIFTPFPGNSKFEKQNSLSPVHLKGILISRKRILYFEFRIPWKGGKNLTFRQKTKWRKYHVLR